MDLFKIFESVRDLLNKFIPQINKVIVFLFFSYFILSPYRREIIRSWIIDLSNSSFFSNVRDILDSFGIEAILPFTGLLILISVIFYFDIISDQIGSLLPPHVSSNTNKILRRHFSREDLIEVWKVNPEVKNIFDINEYLDAVYNRNIAKSGFSRAVFFRGKQIDSLTWMSFFKFLFAWVLSLNLFFPPICTVDSESLWGADEYVLSTCPNYGKLYITLFFILIGWIYFVREYTDAVRGFCIWKLYSFLDLHQDNEKKMTNVKEEDLPDYLKEIRWKQEDRWWRQGPRSKERAFRLTFFSFSIESFRQWRDIALAFIPFFERLPLMKLPSNWKFMGHVENLQIQSNKYNLPVPNQACIDYVQNAFYGRSTKEVLHVSDELKAIYGGFLEKVKGSGMIKITPRGRYNGLLDLEKGGSSYSFSSCCHDINFFCELSLSEGARDFLVEGWGFILEIGDISLPDRSHIGHDFFDQIKDDDKRRKIEDILELETPFSEDEFDRIREVMSYDYYSAEAVVNRTYFLRSFNRKITYEELEDKVIFNDSIVIFRTIDKTLDGSFVILWRLLHGSNTDLDKFTTIT